MQGVTVSVTSGMLGGGKPVADAGKYASDHIDDIGTLAAFDLVVGSFDMPSLVLNDITRLIPESVDVPVDFFDVKIICRCRLVGTDKQLSDILFDIRILSRVVIRNDIQAPSQFAVISREEILTHSANLSLAFVHVIPEIGGVAAFLRLGDNGGNHLVACLVGRKGIHACSGLFAEVFQAVHQRKQRRITAVTVFLRGVRDHPEAVIRHRRRFKEGVQCRRGEQIGTEGRNVLFRFVKCRQKLCAEVIRLSQRAVEGIGESVAGRLDDVPDVDRSAVVRCAGHFGFFRKQGGAVKISEQAV